MRTERKIAVYTASKIEQSDRWIKLRDEWPEIEFTARWPDYIGKLDNSDQRVARVFWVDDMEDVRRSDVVLVYAENHEHLRGALVEAGMALAYGLTVIVIGKHADYGSWQYHPNVIHVSTLEVAREILRSMAEHVRTRYVNL